MATPKDTDPFKQKAAGVDRKAKPGQMLGLAAVAAAIAGVIAAIVVLRPQDVEPQTLCRRDGVLNWHTIVLVDQSDPFTPTDKLWLKKEIETATRGVPRYGRVTLLSIEAGNPFEPTEFFSGCSPGSPDQASSFFQSKALVEAEWRNKLVTPLSAAAEKLLTRDTQDNSPLVETISAVAQRPDFGFEVGVRQIVLVSDMVQNSAVYTHIGRPGPDWDTFMQSPLGGEALPELKGSTLVFNRVPRRTSKINQSKLIDFWKAYAATTGAFASFTRGEKPLPGQAGAPAPNRRKDDVRAPSNEAPAAAEPPNIAARSSAGPSPLPGPPPETTIPATGAAPETSPAAPPPPEPPAAPPP
jgi:hypothetical protein